MSSLKLASGYTQGVLILTTCCLPSDSQCPQSRCSGHRGPVNNTVPFSLRQGALVPGFQEEVASAWALGHPTSSCMRCRPSWESSRGFGLNNSADYTVWEDSSNEINGEKKICFCVWRQESWYVAQVVSCLICWITGIHQHTLLKTVQNSSDVVTEIPLLMFLFLFSVFFVCI